MEFCPKCENVMYVRKKADSKKSKGKAAKIKVLRCSACGYEMPLDQDAAEKYKIAQVITHDGKDLTLVVQGPVGTTVMTEEDREASEDYFDSEATMDD